MKPIFKKYIENSKRDESISEGTNRNDSNYIKPILYTHNTIELQEKKEEKNKYEFSLEEINLSEEIGYKNNKKNTNQNTPLSFKNLLIFDIK